MLTFLLGVLSGIFLTIFLLLIYGLCVVSKRADEQAEKAMQQLESIKTKPETKTETKPDEKEKGYITYIFPGSNANN